MTASDADDTPEIETSERSLTIRRTFDAPRERVWRAFTEADELEQWFVPEGMEATVHANELEVGGAMAITWTDGEHTIENEGGVHRHRRLRTARHPRRNWRWRVATHV